MIRYDKIFEKRSTPMTARALWITLGITMICLGSSSCNAASKHAVAEICVNIDAHGREAEDKVVDRFDAFAAATGLTSSKSNPSAVDYSDNTGEWFISVALSMGPLGVQAALFRSNPTVGTVVRDKLKTFLWRDLAKDYKVTACENSKEVPLPEAWW